MPNRKPFRCLECGKGHTLASAEKIIYGASRCDCGGVDIDLAESQVPVHPRTLEARQRREAI